MPRRSPLGRGRVGALAISAFVDVGREMTRWRASVIAPFDILPPGQRPVVHELVVLPTPVLDGWKIVAAPVAGFSGHTLVVPGEPFRFSTKYGTRLFACAADEGLPERLDEAWMAAHRPTPIPVEQVASVAMTSPLERLTTRLSIDAIGPERIALHVVDEQRVNSFPPAAIGAALVATAALGLFGLMLVRRRRIRTRSA